MTLAGQGIWQHFDKPAVATLCEKNNLPNRALQLYESLEDQQRVVVRTDVITPEFMCQFFGTLSAADPARPAPFASRPAQRTLLMSQVNPGSLYHCGRST